MPKGDSPAKRFVWLPAPTWRPSTTIFGSRDALYVAVLIEAHGQLWILQPHVIRPIPDAPIVIIEIGFLVSLQRTC
jgi:hypothetical protein